MGNMVMQVLQSLFLLLVHLISSLISWFSPSRRGKVYLPAIRDEILLKPATELTKKIKSGELKAERVVQAFIDRINEVEPFVNGIVDKRFSEAILEARQIDSVIQSGNVAVLLHKSLLGVPFVGKDHVAVKDLLFTCGVVARKGLVATQDAEIISNLKAEGAICVGLGNVPELAFSVDCGNMLYGRTKNPFDLSRSPGGSTGGGAAVVAYAGSSIAVGTDIGGSIRIPGFCCGLFGYKPSPLIANTTGFWPECSEEKASLLVAGPLSRHACDLSPVFKSMAGKEVVQKRLPHFDDPVDLSRVTVFFLTGTGEPLAQQTSQELCNITVAAANFFHKEYRSNVRRLDKFKGFDKALSIFTEVIPDSSSTYGEKLTNGHGNINIPIEWLKKLFNLSNYTLAMLILCTMESFKKHNKQRQSRQEKAKGMLEEMKKDFQHLMQNNAIFLMPTLPDVATKHNETLVKFFNFGCPCLFNMLEVPVVQCPLGLGKKGLPLGIQIAAGRGQDHLCLAAAAALERKFGGWISPSVVSLDHDVYA